MHCASCERMIEQSFKTIPGIRDVEASLRRQQAGIKVDDGFNLSFVEPALAELRKLGYEFHPDPPSLSKTRTTGDWQASNSYECALPAKQNKRPFFNRFFRAIAAISLVGIAATFIYAPLKRFIPSIDAGASFGALLAFGFIASVSSCLASTGGFILAYASASVKKPSTISIQTGRLIGFALGGAALGGLGKALPSLSGGVYGWLALILGIGFFGVALNLLDLTPPLSSLGIRLPKFISNAADRIAASKRSSTPFVIGALTFFLPCGFTQTAQALALASGNPLIGGAMMTAFVLGTLPVLSGVSRFGSMAALQKPLLRLAIGSILLFFAFGQLNGGLTLIGSPITPGTVAETFSPKQPATQPSSGEHTDAQVVQMSVTASGYQPDRLTIHAGQPVRWEVNGDEAYGCTNSITIPSLGIFKQLSKGTNVITFNAPQTPGTLPFSCGMGMVRGSFNVI